MKSSITTTSIEELVACMRKAADNLSEADFRAGEGHAYASSVRRAAEVLEERLALEGATFEFWCTPQRGGGTKLVVQVLGLEIEVFSEYLDTFEGARTYGRCGGYAEQGILIPTINFVQKIKVSHKG